MEGPRPYSTRLTAEPLRRVPGVRAERTGTREKNLFQELLQAGPRLRFFSSPLEQDLAKAGVPSEQTQNRNLDST